MLYALIIGDIDTISLSDILHMFFSISNQKTFEKADP